MTDGAFFQGQGIGTTPQFNLVGGQYAVDVNSSGAGTATVVKVLSDGTTVAVSAALAGTSPGSHTLLTLGPGLYQVTVAAATCDVAISRVHQF
jgi:hypothetical protein